MKSEFPAGDRHVLRAFREAPGYLLAATLGCSEKHAVGFVRFEGVHIACREIASAAFMMPRLGAWF